MTTDQSEGPDESKKTHSFRCCKNFNKFLVRIFASLGECVAIHPSYFIVIPLFLTIILSTGLLNIKILEDPIEIFTPDNSPFLQERSALEEHFSNNYTHKFSPSRLHGFSSFSKVTVSAKDGQSILRSSLWPDIVNLNHEINNLTITDDGIQYNYEDLCAKFDGYCTENTVLNIQYVVDELENGTLSLRWPVSLYPFVLPQFLGGITLDESHTNIKDVKAVALMYFLISDPGPPNERSLKWERKLVHLLQNLSYEHIRTSILVSQTVKEEFRVKMDSAIPYIPVTGIFMVVTCMVLLWMKDCVRAKPLVGIVGLISAGMATFTAFGLLAYLGVPFTRMNTIVVFLVLGIGVDDIFVAISGWHKTDTRDPIRKRMAKTYGDAALSVTITSLTNFLAFAIGATTPIEVVRNFCLFSSVAIIFDYLYFITFCGGFLAIAGYLEEKRRHSVFYVKIKPAGKKTSGLVTRLLFSSDLVERDIDQEIELKPHSLSIFFRDQIGSLLCNKYVRVMALISFLVYIAGAIAGCYYLKQGLRRDRSARDDSYAIQFYRDEQEFFTLLPYTVQVMISGDVTYSDPETQDELLKLVKDFENSKFGSTPIFTQFWLRGFLSEKRKNKQWQQKVADEQSLIEILRNEYFEGGHLETELDIDYNENFTKIEATRFLIQTQNLTTQLEEVEMMDAFRKIAADSKWNVTVFSNIFVVLDQFHLSKPLVVQSIIIAAIVVMLVSLLFIPNAIGSVAIAFSIVAIATGVIGYMAFWDIYLDQVSVGCVFACIGFSIDFSAHITYTYLSSNEKTSEGRIKASLFGLGLPIIQGAITTVLSLVMFLKIPGYGYRTFFKTIFLVIIFAVYFSIVLIPLLLALLEYLLSVCSKRINSDKDECKNTHVDKSKVFPVKPTNPDSEDKTPNSLNGTVNEAFTENS